VLYKMVNWMHSLKRSVAELADMHDSKFIC